MKMFGFKTTAIKLSLPVIALAISVSANATPVQFSTTGTFTCTIACVGSGTNSVTFGTGADTITLTFVGTTTQKNLNAGNGFFSNAQGGVIHTTDSAGEQIDDAAITLGATFHLNVNELKPVNGATGTLTGNVEGMIADDFGNAAVQFPAAGNNDLILGGIEFHLQQQLNTDNNGLPGYDIESPGGGTGSTTLQMNLQATALPEPTFLALTGVGFTGLSVLAYRRRKKA